ncbi:MAG: GDP-L-fucose synthase [Rhodospirillales bacterium]
MMSEDPLRGARIWVAGDRGMVGSALMRRLADEDCETIGLSRGELDLRRQADVEDWMAEVRPDVVFVAAARVGGIMANDTQPADFLYDNLVIETNIINSAYRIGVRKLVFLASSCIYPKHADQPISEEALLTGPLEPTNEWYAIAKIAGVKLCQAYRKQHGCDFISAMPSNLYGPGDNFDLTSSHMAAALIRKCHDAKLAGAPSVTVWGTGKPRRDLLYVDDAADALVYLSRHYADGVCLNVGVGDDVTIAEYAQTVADVVGFQGSFDFDATKPDGTPRKLLDVSRVSKLGWQASTSIRDGVAQTYDWVLGQQAAT